MNGLYDYRGECFGFLAKDKLYDLDGQHVGNVKANTITTLTGEFVWHVYKHGIYNKHWESIGYIGSSVEEDGYAEFGNA